MQHQAARAARGIAMVGIALALLGTACDGDDKPAPPTTTVTPDTSVTVRADDSPTLDYTPAELETTAGNVEIVFEQDGSIPHTLVIEGESGLKLKVSKKGDVDRGTIALAKGTYQLYCDIPGHRTSGGKMETTLTVE